jgi:CheY-like chemotaxis protein
MSDDDDRTYHLFVVDDDPATQRMVTNYFEEHDVSASSAAVRQDLTRLLAASEPSLIILDLRLGREDGLDLLREIRSNSDVPVIITTGHRLEEIDRVVGLELGADDYVTKPACRGEELPNNLGVPTRFDAALVCSHLHGAGAALLRETAPSLPMILAVASAREFGAPALAAAGILEVIRQPLASSELAGALTRCLPVPDSASRQLRSATPDNPVLSS